MSTSSCIKLENGECGNFTKHYDTAGDGYPYLCDLFEQTAVALGIASPKSFEYEEDDIYRDMYGDDIPKEIQTRLDRQTAWHDPKVGLEVFKKLLVYFESLPGDQIDRIAQTGDCRVAPESIAYTLKGFTKALAIASERKLRFRIEILV